MKTLTDNLNLSMLELLSVLLPGAVSVAVLGQIDYVHGAVESLLLSNSDWQQGIGYFAASFFMGYLIYVLSSPIDEGFDWLKKKAVQERKQVGMVFTHKGTKCWAWIFFPHIEDTYLLINRILPYKLRDLGDIDAHPINAYQYCYRRLMIEGYAHMFSEVDRYQATAKFFRSMAVVWFLAFFVLISTDYRWVPLVLFLVSLRIYLSRWQKALHVAYKNILILEGLAKSNAIKSNVAH